MRKDRIDGGRAAQEGPSIVRRVSDDVQIHLSGEAARREARLEKAEFDAALDLAYGEISPDELPAAVRHGEEVRAAIFHEVRSRMARQDETAGQHGVSAALEQDEAMSSWSGPSAEDLLARWFADDPDRQALVGLGREILQEADRPSKDIGASPQDEIDDVLARVRYEAAKTRPSREEAWALIEEDEFNEAVREAVRDEDRAIVEAALPGRPDLVGMAVELLEGVRRAGEGHQPGSLGALDAKGMAAFVEELDDSLTSLAHGGILHAAACEAPSQFVDGRNPAVVVVADGRGGQKKRCRLCGSTTPWERIPADSLDAKLVTLAVKKPVTAAATAMRQTRSQKLAKRARDMRAAGRTIAEIATALERTPRQVERYLTGDISSS